MGAIVKSQHKCSIILLQTIRIIAPAAYSALRNSLYDTALVEEGDLANSVPFVGRVRDCFGIPDAPQAEVWPFGDDAFSVTRIFRGLDPDHPLIILPQCDCYFLMLYLAAASHSDIAVDGSIEVTRDYDAGTLCLVDLAAGASIRPHSVLDVITIKIPKSLLLDVSRIPKAPPFATLRSERGFVDRTMKNLAMSLRACFETGTMDGSKALEHLSIAICAHLLETYGRCTRDTTQGITKLTTEQLEQAQLYILANLRRAISGAEIAEALGITEVALEEGLVNALGYDRSELVTRTRLENAKGLLQSGLFTVESIVEECGYESENSFMKAFLRCTGMAPEQWRRLRLH